MTLLEFIKSKGLTQVEVAQILGFTAPALNRWCHNEAIPNADAMRKIIKFTGGAVTANDFYRVHEEDFTPSESGEHQENAPKFMATSEGGQHGRKTA